MNPILANLVRPILASLPSPFDSHAVERELQRLHLPQFEAAVGRYATAPDPLHTFSLQFGRSLSRQSPRVVRPVKKVVSPNLRGRPSTNQLWKRIDK